MKNFLQNILSILKIVNNKLFFKRPDFSEKKIFLQGQLLQEENKKKNKLNNLKDVEFSVFSQFGDDGIISWIINNIPNINKCFVEVGTQDYWESNTRFLLKSENWTGLLIDRSLKDIKKIKKQRIYWQHNLKAVDCLITKENINVILEKNINTANVGLFSIDIDGNDYWVLENLNYIKPEIIVCEFNSSYGDIYKISSIYDPEFDRSKKHFSNIYFGASIKALKSMLEKKGYFFLGTNSAGINAFFVRDDLSDIFKNKIKNIKIFPSKIRESLNEKGKLSYEKSAERIKKIYSMKVYDFDEKKNNPIGYYKKLYSPEWERALNEGR